MRAENILNLIFSFFVIMSIPGIIILECLQEDRSFLETLTEFCSWQVYKMTLQQPTDYASLASFRMGF
jgi:hypothetical protein